MKPKSAIIALVAILSICLTFSSCKKCVCSPCTCQEPCKCNGTDCGNGNCCTPSCGVDSTKMPLNISVFVDLSNRVLKNGDGTTQVDKDTTIINHLASLIKNKVWNSNIKIAKDHFKVFFYPAPSEPTINNLASDLDIDFGKYNKNEMAEKMNMANSMVKTVNDNIKVIYDKTISEANFVGCDIWGFFNDKAKQYCIKKGYRNILIVLTDGYIYHIDNLVKDSDNQTSYITPATLASDTKLIPCKVTLGDLEVLFLEINANPKEYSTKISNTISDWLASMGVKKYDVEETDLPNNTITIISSFLGF